MRKAINIICILLIIAAFVVQLTPYWSFDGKEVSMGGLTWLPTDHADLQSHLSQQTGEQFDINSFVLGPILVEILCILAVVFFAWKPHSLLSGCINTATGAVGVITYLTNSPLRYGMHWGGHLALHIAIVVLGGISLIGGFPSLRKTPRYNTTFY